MVVCGASKASASVRARSCAAAKQRAVQRQCGGECAACERAQPAQAEGNAHLVKVKIWPKRLNEFAGFRLGARATRAASLQSGVGRCMKAAIGGAQVAS